MIGGTAGEVVASKHASFTAGDMVAGMGGCDRLVTVWAPLICAVSGLCQALGGPPGVA